MTKRESSKLYDLLLNYYSLISIIDAYTDYYNNVWDKDSKSLFDLFQNLSTLKSDGYRTLQSIVNDFEINKEKFGNDTEGFLLNHIEKNKNKRDTL